MSYERNIAGSKNIQHVFAIVSITKSILAIITAHHENPVLIFLYAGQSQPSGTRHLYKSSLGGVFILPMSFCHRQDYNSLPKTDIEHLKGDTVRAYNLIISEWVAYIKHLKKDYPYLFSLAIRTNPFNPEAQITVL